MQEQNKEGLSLTFKSQNNDCFDAELKESMQSEWMEYIIEGFSGTKLADKL